MFFKAGVSRAGLFDYIKSTYWTYNNQLKIKIKIKKRIFETLCGIIIYFHFNC